MLKDLASIGDINTREYIRFEQEIITQKGVKNNNNHLRLHKICLENILKFLELPEQVYQIISVVMIFKFP